MSQDTSTSLAPADVYAHLALMRILTVQRQTAAVVILGIISLAALLVLATGIPAVVVKDILAVIFPPLVALAAHSERGTRR